MRALRGKGAMEMKKFVFFVTVLVFAVVAFRRFGPTLSKRAVTKCQEMMAKHAVRPGERPWAQFDGPAELAGTQA
jgi:hypothetical protein